MGLRVGLGRFSVLLWIFMGECRGMLGCVLGVGILLPLRSLLIRISGPSISIQYQHREKRRSHKYTRNHIHHHIKTVHNTITTKTPNTPITAKPIPKTSPHLPPLHTIPLSLFPLLFPLLNYLFSNCTT